MFTHNKKTKAAVLATLFASTRAESIKSNINPSHPTGLEPPPKDWQYEVVHQMKKPLIVENRVDENDFIHFYNENKYEHTYGDYL